ncbi:MAG TPA: Xaa-Pro peptidase family protein [Trebonia sp.]|nr:Xaa-Pro peptidase family protein [Trebonia sp.]
MSVLSDLSNLRAWRAERVRALMREHQLDHLILTGFDNIRYATDYRTQIISEGFDWFAAVIDADGAASVFAPWVDEDQKISEPPAVHTVHPLPSWTPAVPHAPFWADSIAPCLQRPRRIGYELIYPEILSALQERLPDAEFVPVATALFDLRQVKHPDELALLEAAGRINAAAGVRGMAAARPGMTDFDLLAVIMAELQSAGVEYLTHSLCNHRRGSGTWFAAGTVLREGDPYFFDTGCFGVGGYASDIARTGFVGEPAPAVRTAYNVLLDAYQVGQEAARPGTRASEVHQKINDYLERQGYPRTPYALGHGVGLRACELPTIHRADRMSRDQVLQENSVISLEPETGVEVDGEFLLLKIEDNFVVESGGLRLLSVPGAEEQIQ